MDKVYISVLDENGFTTVPPEVIRVLDLKEGDEIIWKIDIDNKIVYLSKNNN